MTPASATPHASLVIHVGYTRQRGCEASVGVPPPSITLALMAATHAANRAGAGALRQ